MILALFFVLLGLVMMYLNMHTPRTSNHKTISLLAMWASFIAAVYFAVKSGGNLNVRL